MEPHGPLVPIDRFDGDLGPDPIIGRDAIVSEGIDGDVAVGHGRGDVVGQAELAFQARRRPRVHEDLVGDLSVDLNFEPVDVISFEIVGADDRFDALDRSMVAATARIPLDLDPFLDGEGLP